VNDDDARLVDRLAAEAQRAVDEDDIVVLPAPAHEIASIALRRWRSYRRRHPKAPSTHQQRVDDLAKGLRERYDPLRYDQNWELDARGLAARLGRVLASEAS
jgi:hypothetical protein